MSEPAWNHQDPELDIQSSPEEGSFIQLQGIPFQLVWDSTSLSAFKFCPRYYQLSIVQGWTTRRLNVHLWWGLEFHKGVETYHWLRANETPHRPSLLSTIKHILSRTWDHELNRPIFYDDPQKNRFTLIRTLVHYLDHYQDDPIQTETLNGLPAVELPFLFDSAIESHLAQRPFMFAGHLDRLGRLGNDYYITDVKTTSSTISPSWFDQFTPDNQFTLYTLAGQVIWHKPIRGAIVDAIQATAEINPRFERGFITRSQLQIAEWHRGIEWWLRQYESLVKTYASDWWPANERSCARCPFRRICSMEPQSRQTWLQADFIQQPRWDPLTKRGDI